MTGSTPMYAGILAVDEGRAGAEKGRLVQDAVGYPQSRQADGLLRVYGTPAHAAEGSDAGALINPIQFLADVAVDFALTWPRHAVDAA